MSYDVKQIIVIRRDLGMRRGKEIAQGSHASISFLTKAMADWKQRSQTEFHPTPDITDDAWRWMEDGFAKVTVQVQDEQEMLDLHEKALAAGLLSNLIQDSGHTEFHMIPTYTALAIGPNKSEDLAPVTGDLKLY